MAAAHLHDVDRPLLGERDGRDQGLDLLGEDGSLVAVAELVDIFHDALPIFHAPKARIASISACASPSSVRIFSVSGGLCRVDAAHGEADMHQHPVADASLDRMRLVDDAGDVDLTLDAADIDGGELLRGVVDLHDSAGDSEAHGAFPSRWLLLVSIELRGADRRLAEREPAVIGGHAARG